MSDLNEQNNESGTAQDGPGSMDPNRGPVPQFQPSPTQTGSASHNLMVKLSADREADALNEGITNIGPMSIELPDAQAQLSGFALPKDQAATLVGQFPQYKFLVKKGESAPSVRIGA